MPEERYYDFEEGDVIRNMHSGIEMIFKSFSLCGFKVGCGNASCIGSINTDLSSNICWRSGGQSTFVLVRKKEEPTDQNIDFNIQAILEEI